MEKVIKRRCLIEEKKNNHRRFEKQFFRIADKNHRNIILDDVLERGKFCYNQKLLEFLQGIEIESP